MNETWSRDEAGKWSRSLTDGLGRLKEVTEDPVVPSGIVSGCAVAADCSNPGGLAYLTVYTYDELDNLKTVQQGSLAERTFNYNSLGWLRSANNPETGTVTYDYDANGNLTSRSDGRGATVTMGYDNWNRLDSKTYASGTAEQTKNVTYRYDTHAVAPAGTSYPKGRLTEVAVENGTVVRYDQIDAEGRIRKHTQITDNVPYAFTYTYNAAGGLESMVYPGGRTVFTCYDAAGRVQSVRKDSATAADVYAQVQVRGRGRDSHH